MQKPSNLSSLRTIPPQCSRAKLPNRTAILLISAIGLLLVFPAILHGVFDAMDIPFHLRWTQQFSEQLWGGDFYPRWLYNMNAGFGSPALFFYAPLPFYITSLFYPLFSPETRQWGQLSGSIAIALIASGVAAYFWLNLFTNRKAALVGALLYMALPYHLGINLYWRFAFAEYWAIVWLPLILYFTYKLIHQSKTAIIGLSFSYALLILTHLFTFAMFMFVPLVYILTVSSRRIRDTLKNIVAIVLAIGIGAIYLLPALFTQGAVSMNAILEKAYFYGNNFLFSRKFLPYHNPYFWYYLEFITFAMITIAVCAFFLVRSSSLRQESQFWLGVSVVTFLMTVPISQPIWNLLPALQRIQFPWRFNSVLLISVTALITIVVHTAIPLLGKRKQAIFALGLILTIGLLLSNGAAMKLRLKPIQNPEVVQDIKINREGAAEYRPQSVPTTQWTTAAIAQLAQQFPQNAKLEGKGTITIDRWRPRDVAFRVNVPAETWVTLKQFFYPTWYARGLSRSLPVEPDLKTGLLRVKVPTGDQYVEVELAAGSAETLGVLVSAIALFVWAVFACFLVFTRKFRASVR